MKYWLPSVSVPYKERIDSRKIRYAFQVLIAVFCSQSIFLIGMFPRILLRVVSWVKSCGQFSVEFKVGSEATLAFVRKWDRDTFRRVCVAVLIKYSKEATREAAVLGQLLSVFGPSVSIVSIVGWSYVLRDTYIEIAGSGYREKLVEYNIFDLRLLKRSLQKCASVVFGILDPFSMAKFIVVRLKGAEHRGWMASRHALRRAVESGDLSMLSLFKVSGNSVGVWPLIVSLLKETGPKTDGGVYFKDSFSVFGSITDVSFSFRKRESMNTCTQIRSQGWSSGCSIWYLRFVSRLGYFPCF